MVTSAEKSKQRLQARHALKKTAPRGTSLTAKVTQKIKEDEKKSSNKKTNSPINDKGKTTKQASKESLIARHLQKLYEKGGDTKEYITKITEKYGGKVAMGALEKRLSNLKKNSSKIAERIKNTDISPGSDYKAQQYHNYGGIKYVGQEGAFQIPGSKFAGWNTPEEGARAVYKQVGIDQSRHPTLSQFVTKYAPPSENNTDEYIQQMAKEAGVSPDTDISEISQDVLSKFIMKKESGTTVRGDTTSYLYNGSSGSVANYDGSYSSAGVTDFNYSNYIADLTGWGGGGGNKSMDKSSKKSSKKSKKKETMPPFNYSSVGIPKDLWNSMSKSQQSTIALMGSYITKQQDQMNATIPIWSAQDVDNLFQQAKNAAQTDPDIAAYYNDQTKIGEQYMGQNLSYIQSDYNTWESQVKRQQENDQRALSEAYAAAGGAESGFRGKATQDMKSDQQAVITSARNQTQQNLNNLASQYEQQYGTDALNKYMSQLNASGFTYNPLGGMRGTQEVNKQLDITNLEQQNIQNVISQLQSGQRPDLPYGSTAPRTGGSKKNKYADLLASRPDIAKDPFYSKHPDQWIKKYGSKEGVVI